jgi:hypothetical protein
MSKRRNIKSGHKQRPLNAEQLQEAMETKLRAVTFSDKRKVVNKKECRSFQWRGSE